MNNDIQSYSDAELRAELERREKSKGTGPEPLSTPAWGPVIETVTSYIHDLATSGYADEDYKHYIFEGAVTAIYGKDVWKWINEVE